MAMLAVAGLPSAAPASADDEVYYPSETPPVTCPDPVPEAWWVTPTTEYESGQVVVRLTSAARASLKADASPTDTGIPAIDCVNVTLGATSFEPVVRPLSGADQGADIFRWYLVTFHGSVPQALAEYGGIGAVDAVEPNGRVWVVGDAPAPGVDQSAIDHPGGGIAVPAPAPASPPEGRPAVPPQRLVRREAKKPSKQRHGRLVVKEKRVGHVFPLDGANSYLILRRGETVVLRKTFEGQFAHLSRSLPTGRYRLTSYKRICDGMCANVGPPTDRCTASFRLRSRRRTTATIRIRYGYREGCTVGVRRQAPVQHRDGTRRQAADSSVGPASWAGHRLSSP